MAKNGCFAVLFITRTVSRFSDIFAVGFIACGVISVFDDNGRFSGGYDTKRRKSPVYAAPIRLVISNVPCPRLATILHAWPGKLHTYPDAVRKGDRHLRRSASLIFAFAALLVCPAMAQGQRIVKPPNVVFNEIIEGMPKADKQQVRVLVGTFNPGDKTVFHTHRFPVTVYVVAGAFTLEMEGRQTVTVKSGEAFVEPPNVKITGYNRSRTERMKAVVFYVSNPHTPFLDLTH